VLALDGPVDSLGNLDSARTELYVPNDFVARETRKYPNLLFGASVNPRRPDALERLRRAKADGAVLLKWLPSIQHFDPADTAFIPFYLALKELGLPLLTHAGKESAFHSAADSLCDPRRLMLPVRLGVKVIVAHAATPGSNRGEANHERLLSMFDGHPDLYADISSLTQINKRFLLKKIVPRREAQGRLLFGSDFPLINTALVSPWYFLGSLGWGEARRIAAIGNPWDKSVELKKALGVPEDVFRRSEQVLLGD
jgi:predicted TIM-barrel fold metal-dependent hydrolase